MILALVEIMIAVAVSLIVYKVWPAEVPIVYYYVFIGGVAALTVCSIAWVSFNHKGKQ